MRIRIVSTESDACTASEHLRYCDHLTQEIGNIYPDASILVEPGLARSICLTDLPRVERHGFEDDVREVLLALMIEVWDGGSFYDVATEEEQEVARSQGVAWYRRDRDEGATAETLLRVGPFGMGGEDTSNKILDSIARRVPGRDFDSLRDHGCRDQLLAIYETAYQYACLREIERTTEEVVCDAPDDSRGHVFFDQEHGEAEVYYLATHEAEARSELRARGLFSVPVVYGDWFDEVRPGELLTAT
jgi:hypothetical protein